MSSPNGTELKLADEKASSLRDPTFDDNLNDGGPVNDNEERYYMSGPKLGVLIASLCLALFLLGLDTAIVSTVSKPSRRSAN